MIFGIGCDISKTERFEKWVGSSCRDGNGGGEPSMIERFFNEKERLPEPPEKNKIPSPTALSHATQHYAARFSAKEAFSKALGTGIEFSLKDVYVEKEESGKPVLKVEGSAKKSLERITGKRIEEIRVLVTLSHEKEYAMAVVVIEV